MLIVDADNADNTIGSLSAFAIKTSTNSFYNLFSCCCGVMVCLYINVKCMRYLVYYFVLVVTTRKKTYPSYLLVTYIFVHLKHFLLRQLISTINLINNTKFANFIFIIFLYLVSLLSLNLNLRNF